MAESATTTMKGLIDKVKKYSYSERIERLIHISVASERGEATPFDFIEMELIQAIRSENGEIEEVKKMREVTEKIEALEKEKEESKYRFDKRYEVPFEDDGAYAD